MTVDELIDHVRGIEAIELSGGHARNDIHKYATEKNIRLLVAVIEQLRHGANNPGNVMGAVLNYNNKVTKKAEVDA